MGEKLFELLIITIAGGVVADIISSSINDGAMPKRRRAGLLIALLMIAIGVCVYFKIPALSLILEVIADTPWWVTASYVVCIAACFRDFTRFQWEVLLISTLIVVISACVYFKLSPILVSITDTTWLVIVVYVLCVVFLIYIACWCVSILIAIYKLQEWSLYDFFMRLGYYHQSMIEKGQDHFVLLTTLLLAALFRGALGLLKILGN